HLCGFVTRESARSQPARIDLNSGTIAAEPAYAASTCNQSPGSSQMGTISGTRSMLEVDVVPTVATTQNGRYPARLSSSTATASAPASMRNSESVGILRKPRGPNPSVITAFSIDE